MKQLFLSLIISVFSLAVTASGAYQAADSLDLFEDITDISRLIQKRTSGEVYVQDTIVPTEPIIIQDTILPKERVTDYIIPGVITPSEYVSRNPLDSIYIRNERGILQLPSNY